MKILSHISLLLACISALVYAAHAAPQLLHKLAQFGPRDYIRDLIESGTEADAQDIEGRTALIFAASAGNIKNLLTLLAAGAQLLKQDKQKRNAVLHAIQTGQKKKIKLALAAIYLLSQNKEQETEEPESTPDSNSESDAKSETEN